MLLIYSQKITPRCTYAFKHVFFRILGLEIRFTATIEEFIAHSEPKLSYGKQPLANELFFQEYGLLSEQGIEDIIIQVKHWDTVPAFFATSTKSAIPFDIFSATFYLLSRYEEYLPHVKDEIGRYPASESVGFQNNFLEIPVIDVWAYKLKELLITTFPSISFPKKSIAIHNILHVQRPFQYNQKGVFRSLAGYLSDLSKLKFKCLLKRSQVLLKLRKDPFDTFNWIVNITKRSTSKMTTFFLLGENELYQDSLNTHRKAFRQLVKFVGDYKEVGLLYSGSSLERFEILREEKKRMEGLTNRALISGKQANFFLNLPENYRNLIELEIAKDFTMAYQDTLGFRAGTCTPFLFYDLDYEIKTPLMLHPIAMTTAACKEMPQNTIENKVQKIMQQVKSVNGTFSLVFTNEDFIEENKSTIWRKLFAENLQNYD